MEAYAFINDLCNKYKLITADVTADIARSNFQNGKCAYYIGEYGILTVLPLQELNLL